MRPRPVGRPYLRGTARCLLLGGALLGARPAAACDSSTCLMLTRGTAGLTARGSFQVDLSFLYTSYSARREGTSSTDTVVRPKVFIEQGILVPGYHQDQTGHEGALQLDLSYGLATRTTVYASLPLLEQKYYEIGHQGFSSVYNIRGLGDLVLGARQALYRSPQRTLVASLGFKVPTGRNGIIDDFDSTILEPTMQPGTGSGDVIGALQWSNVAPGKTQVSLSASYQVYTENGYRYAFGDEAIGALTLGRAFHRLTPSLQVKLYHRNPSHFVGDEVPSTGSTVLYLNAGLRYQAPEALGFYGFLLLPAYRDVNDAQLAPSFSALLGLSKTF